MSVFPNITCRRCHRQYPSFRSRCPFCGTRKEREVRSAVPESDSAVTGTEASRSAAESVNWQMLIGAVLLIAVFLVTTILVTMNVQEQAADIAANAEPTADLNATPIPTPTAIPTPSPTPPPTITSISVKWDGNPSVQSYIPEGYWEGPGYEYEFQVFWYPQDVRVVPEWTSSDESIIKLTPSEDGQKCKIATVGESGQEATVTVKVGNFTGENSFTVHIT